MSLLNAGLAWHRNVCRACFRALVADVPRRVSQAAKPQPSELLPVCRARYCRCDVTRPFAADAVFCKAPGSVHHPRLQPVTLQFLLPQREYMSKGAKRLGNQIELNLTKVESSSFWDTGTTTALLDKASVISCSSAEKHLSSTSGFSKM